MSKVALHHFTFVLNHRTEEESCIRLALTLVENKFSYICAKLKYSKRNELPIVIQISPHRLRPESSLVYNLFTFMADAFSWFHSNEAWKDKNIFECPSALIEITLFTIGFVRCFTFSLKTEKFVLWEVFLEVTSSQIFNPNLGHLKCKINTHLTSD